MNKLKQIKICLLLITIISLLFTSTAKAIIIPREENTFNPKHFLGKWDMQTIVTSSKCPYVLVGSTTESNLEIKDVRILWKGGNWKTSIGKIKFLNSKEAISERVTEMKTNDKNNWKAILIDHLKLDENNIMHLESIVIQYKNGISVGEYKTLSILTKSEQ